MSHHLPEASWFWVSAAVIAVAAAGLGLRSTRAADRLFVLILVLMGLVMVDFALVLAQWPAEGLSPATPGGPVSLPEGLGLPSLFWALIQPVVLVAAVLFVGLVPVRREWVPPAPYHWAAAVALVGLVYLVDGVEFERAYYLRSLAWALVFPTVGVLLLRDAIHRKGATVAPLLLLSFAFFVHAVPTATVDALDSWIGLRAGPAVGRVAEIDAGQIVGGALVALVALGAATYAVVEASRRERWDRGLLAFAGGVLGLIALALVVWVPYGDAATKRLVLELGTAVAFAVFGVAGLWMLPSAPGGPAAEDRVPDAGDSVAAADADVPAERDVEDRPVWSPAELREVRQR